MSSAKTMELLSLATSVPIWPMAMPTSARFKAKASLTPSPVMATTYPCFCRLSKIFNFVWGVNLAKTETCLIVESNSFSSSSSSSFPVRTEGYLSVVLNFSSSCSIRPIFSAMAKAVSLWSPVFIITRMPAILALAIASLTSGRGGSFIPTNPTKVIFLTSSVFNFSVS